MPGPKRCYSIPSRGCCGASLQPSYCDRVIFHTLPDMRHLLHPVAYDASDDIDGSDHRPVALRASLIVNRGVRPTSIMVPDMHSTKPHSVRRRLFRMDFTLTGVSYEAPCAPPPLTAPGDKADPAPGRFWKAHSGSTDSSGGRNSPTPWGETRSPSSTRAPYLSFQSLGRSSSSIEGGHSADEAAVAVAGLDVLFPLNTEDLLGSLRWTWGLEVAMLGGKDQPLRPCPGDVAGPSPGQKPGWVSGNVHSWGWDKATSDGGVGFTAVVMGDAAPDGRAPEPPHWLHAVVRVQGRQGQDLGQAVVSVGDLLRRQGGDAANLEEETVTLQLTSGGRPRGKLTLAMGLAVYSGVLCTSRTYKDFLDRAKALSSGKG
jgi:hypothetical protein